MASSAAANDLRRQIRDLKRQMRADDMRIMSSWNGGLTMEEHRCNTRLEVLKAALDREEAER